MIVVHIIVNMILKDHEDYYHSYGYKSFGTLLQTLPFPLLIAYDIFSSTTLLVKGKVDIIFVATVKGKVDIVFVVTISLSNSNSQCLFS